MINKAEPQLSRVRSGADSGSSERKELYSQVHKSDTQDKASRSQACQQVSPMYTNERRQSDTKCKDRIHEKESRAAADETVPEVLEAREREL